MTTAISIARFSDRPDAATSKSNDAQHADNLTYCQRMGYEIELPLESETAVSGKDKSEPVNALETIHGRPTLLRAITRCKKGYVLVCSFRDRIARDPYIQTAVERQLAHQGARLESVNELNGDDLGPKMTRAVLAVLAEEKRAEIALRTMLAMRIHQAQGRRMGRADRVLYGWKVDPESPPNRAGKPGGIIPDADEQKIIAMIRELAQQGLGARAICTRLDAASIARRGKTWKKGCGIVQAIIERTIQA